MTIGKRLKKAREGIDREKLYPLVDAIKMVKERAKSKFDETIEIAINLGVDPRHADQMVRGVVVLPNGTGRTLRVGVFARGAKADEAKAAGADVVGAEDLVAKVQVREIAEKKMKDLNCDTIESAMKMVEGSARSMGLEVSG